MADVRAIHALLQEYAEQGLLLGRSLSSLYDHLRDYLVFSVPAGQGVSELAGVCSLHICWEDLAEVRSLAVAAAWQGRGIGSALVCACIEEAARLEGASRAYYFRRVVFPLLMPTTLFVLVNAVINSFKLVDQLFILTKGGPDNASSLLLYYIYEVAFSFFDDSYAATLTVVLLAALALISLGQFLFLDRRIHYR